MGPKNLKDTAAIFPSTVAPAVVENRAKELADRFRAQITDIADVMSELGEMGIQASFDIKPDPNKKGRLVVVNVTVQRVTSY